MNQWMFKLGLHGRFEVYQVLNKISFFVPLQVTATFSAFGKKWEMNQWIFTAQASRTCWRVSSIKKRQASCNSTVAWSIWTSQLLAPEFTVNLVVFDSLQRPTHPGLSHQSRLHRATTRAPKFNLIARPHSPQRRQQVDIGLGCLRSLVRDQEQLLQAARQIYYKRRALGRLLQAARPHGVC